MRHASFPSLLRDASTHGCGKCYAGTQWHFQSCTAWCAAHTCVHPCGDPCSELALHPHAHPSTAPPRLGGRLARPTHKLLDVFRLARVAACAGGLYSLRGGAQIVHERCAGRRATCFSCVMGHVQAAVGQTAQYTSSLEHRWSLGFACMSCSARYLAPISDHHACAVFGVCGWCPRPDCWTLVPPAGLHVASALLLATALLSVSLCFWSRSGAASLLCVELVRRSLAPWCDALQRRPRSAAGSAAIVG